MTKKDYVTLAEAFKITLKEVNLDPYTFESCLWNVAHCLKVDNPKFESQKFYDYVSKGIE